MCYCGSFTTCEWCPECALAMARYPLNVVALMRAYHWAQITREQFRAEMHGLLGGQDG